jgi:hypothetical protein
VKNNLFGTEHRLAFDKLNTLRRLFMLSEYWIPRSTEYPFYTLGRSAYLDGKTPQYKEKQKAMNALLYDNFVGLYKTILHTLQDELDEEVVLAEDLCYPGFHIFPSDEKFLTIAGNWHQDYPHITLGLPDIDPSTFTVPIIIPESGAGIDYIIEKEHHYLPYKEKVMLWHDGKTLHRIAGFKEYKPRDFRITMQGHLIRRNNRMEVFW